MGDIRDPMTRTGQIRTSVITSPGDGKIELTWGSQGWEKRKQPGAGAGSAA